MNPGHNLATDVRVWWHWNVYRGYWRWAGEEGVKVLIWRGRAVLFLIKKVVWVLAVITCLSTGILRNRIYFRTCFFRWADLAWWKLRVVMLYKNHSCSWHLYPKLYPKPPADCCGNDQTCNENICPVSRLIYVYEYPKKACNSQIF